MSTGNELVTLKQVNDYYKDLRKRSAPVIFNSAVGNPVVFSDGADGLPIQSLKVHLLPRQEGTGDPSPENIRSIVPWNGLTVWNGGANVWDEQWEVGSISEINGANENGNDRIRSKGYISVTPSTRYYRTAPNSIRVMYYDAEKQYINYTGYGINNLFQTPDNCRFIRFNTAGAYGNVYKNDISINHPSTKMDYEASHIIETDVEFLSSVYGGTLNVVSGVLTVEWVALSIATLPREHWVKSSSYPGGFYINVSAVNPAFKIHTPFICSHGKSASALSDYIYGTTFCDSSLNFRFMDSSAEMQDWYDYMDEQVATGTPIIACYPLATPQEIQLTPAQLQTLLGNNTIWSDANGDIEVEYRADTDKFISNAIANQPHATSGGYGIMTPGAGLSVLNDKIITVPAGTQSIKAGTSSNLIISPAFVGDAAFYGLARAAGVDMANSSNPVGQFTDEAKIAIQKMLGIYEAPWELIREDTVTNETADDVIINVDGNGQSFELTDLILQIKVPLNTNTVIGSYGLVHLFYYGNSDTYIPAMLNAFSGPKQHDWFASVYVKREKNSLMVDYAPYSESGNNRTKNVRNQFDFNYNITQIIKILLRNVQGTVNYKLYGKRRWN